MKKIAMGNDHSAVEMKEAIKAYVEQKGYEVIDFGTNSSESCDYPVYGEKVGRAVASGEADYGIALQQPVTLNIYLLFTNLPVSASFIQ